MYVNAEGEEEKNVCSCTSECTCVGVCVWAGEEARRTVSEGRKEKKKKERGWVQKWLLGMQVRLACLSAHPSLSLLSL